MNSMRSALIRGSRSRPHGFGFDIRSGALKSFGTQSECESESKLHDAKTPAQKKNFQLVIIGTGWAGYKLLVESKKLREELEKANSVKNDFESLDVIVVSERNHFLYTPLLASTTVGTLEFRSIIETVRVGGHQFRDESHFHLSSVSKIHPERNSVSCKSQIDGYEYEIPFDALVVATGCVSNTFGIKGVNEHAYFLKEIWHARKIRDKILANFELATQPHQSEEAKKQLLQFVVVGGGPTGVEFCAELYDFIVEDFDRICPKTAKYLSVVLLDPGEILSTFDEKLRSFAMDKFAKRENMKHIRQTCVEIQSDRVILSDGTEIPSGIVIWTAGVGPNDLTKSLPFTKAKNGNLLTDQFCRVKDVGEKHHIYAIGDCGEIENYPLPLSAQVAQAQADYLSRSLGQIYRAEQVQPFTFKPKGLMTYLGGYEGLFETTETEVGHKRIPKAKLAGLVSWFIWRSAYLTKLGSWRLRMQVPIDWLKAFIVGRDISRF